MRIFNRAALLAGILLAPLSHAATPPNLILVLSDDLGYGDLACYGHPEIKTPNLDRLATSGLRLTHCYAAGANCSPARAGLMTGRTPYRVGIYNQLVLMGPMHLRQSEITIATLLKQAGYATAQVGKWHLNGLFNLPGQPQPSDHGFDHWFAVQNNALPNHHNPYNFVRNGIPQGPIEGYSAQIVANEAIAWLSSLRDKSKPFFLYVAFSEPHETINSDPRFYAPYEGKHRDEPARIAYYGSVSQMDDALGRILRALEAQGLADNTVVWFTSDNGPALSTRTGQHGSTGGLREYKGHVYEGGIRVPGIIRWPGRIKPGSISAEPVSGVDVLPTLCQIAGIAPPSDRTLDGTSVVPILTGGAVERTKPLYWQFMWTGSKPQVALRQGPWKLLAAMDPARPSDGKPSTDITETQMHLLKTARLTGFELYRIDRDPGETTDLAATEPAKFAELKTVMEKYHAEVRAEGPVWPAFTDPRWEPPRHKRPDFYGAKSPPPKKSKQTK